VRRLLLFAALLLLLGLSTAFAASFDLQAEDVTSFSSDVSISVPTTVVPPLATGNYFLVGAPPHGSLVTTEPTSTGGNEKGSFVFTSTDIGTEDRAPESGGKVYYVAWSTGAISTGVRFDNQKVQVHFTRTGQGGVLTVGLFNCTAGAAAATLTASGCVLMSSASGPGEQIDIGPFTHTVAAGRELRLKMVDLTADDPSVQWGYKEQNRSARLVVLAPGVT
jgi:hypothetical protein